MPIFEPTVLQPDQVKLRHIGPRAAVWPTSPAQDVTVLGRTDMVARPLPVSNVPANADFASGSWTTRLDDSGECSFVFPNVVSSDGLPWRERFDPSGHGQFLEVTYNGHLEGVFCIDTVTPTQQQITVHGQDGWFLLKKAYVRDWTVVMAPRDVIERGTQVWVPTTVDNFPYVGTTTPSAQWTNVSSGGATAQIAPGGGLSMAGPASIAQINGPVVSFPATGTWRAAVSLGFPDFLGGPYQVVLEVVESSGDVYGVGFTTGDLAEASGPGGQFAQIVMPVSPSYGLLLESDGEWIWAFVNGQLLGCIRRANVSTTSLQVRLVCEAATVTVGGVLLASLQPFLMP
jgi:hypothetical protein